MDKLTNGYATQLPGERFCLFTPRCHEIVNLRAAQDCSMKIGLHIFQIWIDAATIFQVNIHCTI